MGHKAPTYPPKDDGRRRAVSPPPPPPPPRRFVTVSRVEQLVQLLIEDWLTHCNEYFVMYGDQAVKQWRRDRGPRIREAVSKIVGSDATL